VAFRVVAPTVVKLAVLGLPEPIGPGDNKTGFTIFEGIT
jgi:hypothetical protein